LDIFLILTGLFLALVAALYFVEWQKPVPAGGGGGHGSGYAGYLAGLLVELGVSRQSK
jgi:dihydroxyacetone kinase